MVLVPLSIAVDVVGAEQESRIELVVVNADDICCPSFVPRLCCRLVVQFESPQVILTVFCRLFIFYNQHQCPLEHSVHETGMSEHGRIVGIVQEMLVPGIFHQCFSDSNKVISLVLDEPEFGSPVV